MIKINNLWKKYCLFKFENGIYQIIGNNGTSKSVFLRILSGIEKPTHGKVENNNKLPKLFLTNIGIGLPYLSIKDNISISSSILGVNLQKKLL